MKNSFKFFFLLTSLFSAVASVTNSSLPLSETNLTMERNSSELVERKQQVKTFLSGGMLVKVLTFYPKGKTSQRECTLSFPVKDKEGYEGYLTSWNCGNRDVFVEQTKIGYVENKIANFDPQRGLDYVFVKIYEAYWNDAISSCVAFNEVFNNNEFDFLPMTVPTRPPFIDITVCAYGGGGRFTCGVIIGFNLDIQVYVPWEKSNGGTYTTDRFFGVHKVLMEKDYTRGDMGAPVYIPGQIPFQTQLVVTPVGMVVENVDKSLDKDPNTWYYTPIDRILQDSGLELMLGNFD